jgi:hypothetical protein
MSILLMHLDELRGIELAEVDATVALQTRIDRKYVIAPRQLELLLERIADEARILDIGGRRRFGYRSVYFDTPAFDSYLGAARRRPDRFKVRTRMYVGETGGVDASWIEVKLRTRRGQTAKHRQAHDPRHPASLTSPSLAFVAGFARLAPIAHELDPVVTTCYRRSTLVMGASRATIDVGLECLAGDGSQRDRIVTLGDRVIVETKSERAPSVVDRALWDLSIRPTVISKFAIGAATLFPELPCNKWHRTIADHVSITHG